MRTRASPDLTNSSPLAASRIARVAAPPGSQAGVIEPRLRQHEFVAAAEVGEIAAEQPGPGQRVRMTGERVRPSPRETPSAPCWYGARLTCPARPPCRAATSAPNRPRALGSLASSPRNGWASIMRSSSRFELAGVEEQHSLLLEERRTRRDAGPLGNSRDPRPAPRRARRRWPPPLPAPSRR